MTTRTKRAPGEMATAAAGLAAAVVEASGDAPAGQVEASGEAGPIPSAQDQDAKTDRFLGRPGASGTAKEMPRPGIAWGNVINDTFRIDSPNLLAKRLREELALGDGRTDYGRVLEALDKSAHNVDEASRLYRAAKLEEERYGLECSNEMETLRSQAVKDLNIEYRDKKRSSPTIKDIEDRMLADYPDQYKTLKERTAEVHEMVRALKTLLNA